MLFSKAFSRFVAILGTSLCLFGQPVFADTISDLENQIELVKKQTELELEKNKLLKEKLANVTQRAAIAAKQNELSTAVRNEAAVLIKVNSAYISSKVDGTKRCNAAPFVEHKCNGEKECDFKVDETICGDPSNKIDAKNIVLNYSCDKLVKDASVNFGLQAHLTCN
ncbi:hypothetical protein [Amylibacter sp. IMCC11727]|uniref:hypothetical protein n=1 Tax=Amylibacter sp. IMCC11727 TaxID=3039851 RepID=UPI00244DAEF3|nr:hypothetical protein [Amylibacter sp. IMCC11727]WGI21121.1 hypothetical protein QBD29_13525 [Amylibacter sp. IMCC11727]